MHIQLTGDHITRAGAGMNIGNLKAGGREIDIAGVPHAVCQFVQRRGEYMQRVDGQLRVRHMALATLYDQVAGQGATTAIFNGVT